jgi:hypothetical protein
MPRLSIPSDVTDLIQEVSGFVSPSSTQIDVIRIALFRMKEEFVLSKKQQPTLDNPAHQFYSKLTQEEEKSIIEYFKDKKKEKPLKNKKDIENYFNNL